MSENIRLFIAIKLSEEIKTIAGSITEQLKETKTSVSWIKKENLHLTLKFIGNFPFLKLNILKEVLSKTIPLSTEVLQIKLNSIGGFPNLQRPRIIWLGIDDQNKNIQNLAQEIEKNISTIGIKKEVRGFNSHITLGRVRDFRNIEQLQEKINRISIPSNTSQIIKGIVLFKSTLNSQGSIYEVVEEFKLG